MKLRLALIVCLALAATPVFAEEKQELKTPKEKMSYAIGLDMGNSLKRNELDVDPDVLGKAIKDILTGNKPLMTDKEVKETIKLVQKDLQAKQQERMKVQAEKLKGQGEKNQKEGETFLEKNKSKAMRIFGFFWIAVIIGLGGGMIQLLPPYM